MAAILFSMLITMSLVGCGPKKSEDKAKADTGISVRTGIARMGSMSDVIEVSGDIKALKTTSLSAKIPGRVVAVPYREGDSVGAGSVVVRQDTSDLLAQVQQADAALLAARARASQAHTSAGLSDTQTESSIVQAQAGLDAAKARLQMMKKGARSQEVATVENAVISAKASFQNADANRKRLQKLFADGAISQQQMELANMQYDVTKAQFETAKQQSSLVKAGAREEEIESAQKQVDQAEEALLIAKSNRGQKSLRQEDIKSAQAGVAQAEAALSYARQQVQNAYIASPISGTIAKRLTEPGQMASPGLPVMEIVALDTVYLEAGVSEMDIGKIKVGQTVLVAVDALAGRKFQGRVTKVLPTADTKLRKFMVRIEVLNRTRDLKPGMFARGGIEVARHNNTVIIPKDALVANGDSQSIFAVVDGTAILRPVMVGFETREEVEILSGISAGDELVTVGQDKLSDGVKVNGAH